MKSKNLKSPQIYGLMAEIFKCKVTFLSYLTLDAQLKIFERGQMFRGNSFSPTAGKSGSFQLSTIVCHKTKAPQITIYLFNSLYAFIN